MNVDMRKLREYMLENLHHADEEEGFELAVDEFGEEEIHDPDTLLSLARSEGIDLSDFEAGPETPDSDVFNTKYDTDEDLDDLNNDVDDLSGDYY